MSQIHKLRIGSLVVDYENDAVKLKINDDIQTREAGLITTLDAIENLLSAQHKAGVDITSNAHMKALNKTIERTCRKFKIHDAGVAQGVAKMLDASTSHLTEKEKELLTAWSQAEPNPNHPRVAAHEYGWTIYMTDNKKGQKTEIAACEDPQGGLAKLIAYAQRVKAYIINLDPLSMPIDGIKEVDV